jgi:hypothetical protein
MLASFLGVLPILTPPLCQGKYFKQNDPKSLQSPLLERASLGNVQTIAVTISVLGQVNTNEILKATS